MHCEALTVHKTPTKTPLYHWSSPALKTINTTVNTKYTGISNRALAVNLEA